MARRLALPVLLATACAHPRAPVPSPALAGLDAALLRATTFLLSAQSEDGSWRSESYQALADGRALTPVVLSTLLFAAPHPELEARYHRGVAFVASLVRPDGTLEEGPYGLEYPVYTLAASLLVLSLPQNAVHADKIPPLLAALSARQLAEERGFVAADLAYGGWGYHRGLPERPAGPITDELLSSNVTSTLFAVGALALAGVGLEDPRFARARVFLERCQNFGGAGDDGGFFHTPTSDTPNKAGRGADAPPGRYRSYGTTTADGLRALLRVGVGRDDLRVQAAARWLLAAWDPAQVPGDYPPEQEVYRRSGRYYWAWTSAHALLLLGPAAETHPNTRGWPERLSAELLAEQRADGSFHNPAADLREDDALVATPLAAAALAIARLARAPGLITAVRTSPVPSAR